MHGMYYDNLSIPLSTKPPCKGGFVFNGSLAMCYSRRSVKVGLLEAQLLPLERVKLCLSPDNPLRDELTAE
jgi:hypothetical protein